MTHADLTRLNEWLRDARAVMHLPASHPARAAVVARKPATD